MTNDESGNVGRNIFSLSDLEMVQAGTVIRDCSGDIMARDENHVWYILGTVQEWDIDAVALPAVVIYEPKEDSDA